MSKLRYREGDAAAGGVPGELRSRLPAFALVRHLTRLAFNGDRRVCLSPGHPTS